MVNAANRPGRKNSTGRRINGKMRRSARGKPMLKKKDEGTLYQLFRVTSVIARILLI
jgi:hypothetical protein